MVLQAKLVAASRVHCRSTGQAMAPQVGHKLRVGGWVKTGREAGGGDFCFLEVNDGSTFSNLQVRTLQRRDRCAQHSTRPQVETSDHCEGASITATLDHIAILACIAILAWSAIGLLAAVRGH